MDDITSPKTIGFLSPLFFYHFPIPSIMPLSSLSLITLAMHLYIILNRKREKSDRKLRPHWKSARDLSLFPTLCVCARACVCTRARVCADTIE